MEDRNRKPATVDEYIAQFPEEIRQILESIRAVVKECAPDAGEKISYQMPGYYLHGGLVWFGAYKKHIGFYPLAASVDEAFNRELAAYRGTKGSLHFPLDKPMPYDLIRKIVRLRLAENQEKAGRTGRFRSDLPEVQQNSHQLSISHSHALQDHVSLRESPRLIP